MKTKKFTARKSRAQALVEFAIVLPLLLLLLYGLLEAGRLLFLYANVVTASRQAVRYGSATGVGNGTGNPSEPRYQDCDGIRGAASKTAFLGAFDTIDIYWDNGPTSPPQLGTPYCANPAQTDNTFTPSASNSTRITVTVTEAFNPIVPLIVPFAPKFVTATSSRTILRSVRIEISPTPGASPTPTATNTPTPTDTPTPAGPSDTPTITETLQYTYTPTLIPTDTPIPSATPTWTPSVSPTPTLTDVPSCSRVVVGRLQHPAGTNTMTLLISNNESYPLTFRDVTVTWNSDRGHQATSDKSLILQSASLQGVVFWSGNVVNQSTYTISASPVIPANGQNYLLVFTFHQSYDNFDGTEDVYINLSTPGCENNPIHAR